MPYGICTGRKFRKNNVPIWLNESLLATGTASPDVCWHMPKKDGTKRNCALDTKAMETFGKSLASMGWTKTFSEEIETMNKGKVGRPFEFSESMILWAIAFKTVFKCSFRLLLGFLNHFLSKTQSKEISLTQFYDRCNNVDFIEASSDKRFLACGKGSISPKEWKIDVALDSTGISLNKYGGWLMTKWGFKKVTGWIKLHVAVNADTNEILAFVITTEKCGDITCTDKLMELVENGGHKVRKLLADAAYDSKANWKKYTEKGINVCINIKSPQLTKYDGARYEGKSNGCISRGLQIKRIKEVGREQWKEEKGYGKRWKVECTFSDLKRILGDILRSRKIWTNVLETFWKVKMHNSYKTVRSSLAGGW